MPRSTNRNRFRTLKIDPNLKLCKPRPMTIRAVVGNSLAETYDEAKIEWELENVFGEDSEGFSNICDLCGNQHLKISFILYNPSTGKRLNVGSRCIIRFGVLKGNVDIESGSLLVNNFIKSQEMYFNVRSLIKGMMVLSVDAKDFQMFLQYLKQILELKNITNPSIDQLGEICYGERWNEHKDDKFIRARLHMLWYKPMQISTIKVKAKNLSVIKEGDTYWGKKRTSVYLPGQARPSSNKKDKMSDKRG